MRYATILGTQFAKQLGIERDLPFDTILDEIDLRKVRSKFIRWFPLPKHPDRNDSRTDKQETGSKEVAVNSLFELANQDNAQAQYDLGVAFENGELIDGDDKEAVRWYRLAAEQGYPEAQYRLGLMYRKGLGLMADLEESANWIRRAAESGLAKAQLLLGGFYGVGEGVPKDYVEAYFWYRLAALNGEKRADDVLPNLEKALTSENVMEVETRIRDWELKESKMGSE